MKHVFANNAVSKLASSVGVADAAIALIPGGGSLFPYPGDNEGFYLTVEDEKTKAMEVMVCTQRIGDNLFVQRGQDGTSPAAFLAGAVVSQRITKAVLEYLRDDATGDGVSNTDFAAFKSQTNAALNTKSNASDVQAGLNTKLDISTYTPFVQDTTAKFNTVNATLTTLTPLTDHNAFVVSTNNAIAAVNASKQPNLGFTPVQQGGGASQNNNKIYLGWDNTGLRHQIDGVDQGYLAARTWVTSNYSPVGHVHDDRYYTQSFLNTRFSGVDVKIGAGTSGAYPIHGSFVGNITGGGVTVTFPVPFGLACQRVICMNGDHGSTGQRGATFQLASMSTTGFVVGVTGGAGNGTNIRIDYIAYGF